VEGPTLARALTPGPLPWRAAVRICAQVATGLAAAHARGIVHRDVKPDNVMLSRRGAKLVDFGISASVGELDSTPDGELLGTPAYLAPERLATGSVRAACDVYALGLLLYQALTGELPWRRAGLIQLLQAHQHDPPATLDRVPGLPPEVAELYQRCLAKQPADRPSSAEAARTLAAASSG
jgi:serine/threonine-protein kinase